MIKGRFKFLFLVFLIFALLSLAACGCREQHECKFDIKSVSAETLASKASCTAAASYYYSCACGKIGTESFSDGEPTAHSFTVKTVVEATKKSAASCTAPAEYYYSCTCGKIGTESFSDGEPTAHSFTVKTVAEATKKSAASCTAPAEYYYSCTCGKIGTESFSDGEPTAHSFTVKTVAEATKKSAASCTAPAEYYYSCTCGKIGTESFSDGEPDPSNHSATFTYVKEKREHHKHYSCCNKDEAAEQHSFNSGICSVCAHVCPHEGGLATCSERASCAICTVKYGETDPNAHSYQRHEIVRESDCKEHGVERLYCVCGDYVENEIEELAEHDFLEWSIYKEASCLSGGEEIRSCSVCKLVEVRETEPTEHSFSAVDERVSEGVELVSLVCADCGAPAGAEYRGVYLDSEDCMFLYECPLDFSFEVFSDEGADYILENLIISDIFYQSLAMEGTSQEEFESFSVTELGEGRYRISPTAPYSECRTYFAIAGEGIRFTDKIGNAFLFGISGEESADVEFCDAIFLKSVAASADSALEYEIAYDDENMAYVLAIPSAYGISEADIGSLLVIGDCESFSEAEELSEDEVTVAKIAEIREDGGIKYLLLTVPSFEEIYSKMDIKAGSSAELDAEALDAEFKNRIAEAIIRSDDFAAAVSSANVAAKNYASSVGLTAEAKLDIDLDEIKVTAEVSTVDLNTVRVTVTVSYEHSVPLSDGELELGSLSFDMTFETSLCFNIKANSNIREVIAHEVKKSELSLDCTVTNTVTSSFDLHFNLSMDYGYTGELFYVVNLKTGKIHLPSCRFAPSVVTGDYAYLSYYELACDVEDFTSHECGVCHPFTMADSGFAITASTGTVHCVNCMYVKEAGGDVTVYKNYPLGMGGADCSVCKPEEHTKSLDEYLEESVKDASFDEMFGIIKAMLTGKCDGAAESPIGNDTKPRINIKLYCFEVPIYVEPKMSFDLKADFKLHYESEVTSSVFVALVRDGGGYKVIGGCNVGEPTKDLEIDLTGSLDVEIGVITEIRLGVRYLSKQVYIGILGEAGMYMDMDGIYHLDTSAGEQYFGARSEIGIYTELRCTYRVLGIIPADSFEILPKKYHPVFNSGDERIYNRFVSYEDTMSFANSSVYYLDNALLEVNYYDLTRGVSEIGRLNWGERVQYGFDCTFTDASGEEVDYIRFERGALYLAEDAPESFTVTMRVRVYDKITPETLEEYFGTHNPGGCAIFLEEKQILISYSTSDTSAIADYLGMYEGWFTTDWCRRSQISAIHKVDELYNDERALQFYADILNYIRLDENGNPKKLFTVEYLRELLLEVECEYIHVSYSSPGDNIFDTERGMFAAPVYYDGELVFSGAPIYVYVSDGDYTLLYFKDVVRANDGTLTGSVSANREGSDVVGEFYLEKFELE